MATLSVRMSDLATRVSTECKAIRTLVNGNAADLAALTTTSKVSLVSALNELKGAISTIQGAGYATIDDASTSDTTKTWSITKIASEITAALNALTTGAPTALNTLDELANALGDDANFAATITAALGNRVRVDTAAQGLTTLQQQNARANINAMGAEEIGSPDTNFVTIFNTGLV